MSITSVDRSAIIDAPGVLGALSIIYPATDLSSVKKDPDGGWPVEIDDEDEPWFRVGVSDDGSQIGINGLFDQNAKVAAAIRSKIPEDAPRIIAIEPDLGFIDLTWGITADQIEAGWCPFDEFRENE